MDAKKKEVKELTSILSEMCLEEVTSPIKRTSVETLMTIQVHQWDITRELRSKDVNDFEW
jgi:hypothetical protein